MSVHILHTPMEEVDRRSDGERWCFVCRTRREFAYVLFAPVEMSYYGMTRKIECTHCHTTDSDLFPGREREGA
jgi:hypothetical protein